MTRISPAFTVECENRPPIRISRDRDRIRLEQASSYLYASDAEFEAVCDAVDQLSGPKLGAIYRSDQ